VTCVCVCVCVYVCMCMNDEFNISGDTEVVNVGVLLLNLAS